ncbi:MAG: trypsin-like peptidase domain-containing protein [Rhodothermales bacterium]
MASKKETSSNEITPTRIVLRHSSGSKANQVEEFPLNHYRELTFGRTATSSVKYDPDKDDLVSRQHAKIVQDENDPTQFTIHDQNSSNGTFVNKQRIIGVARIVPGDVIQFGPGGPEFEFDLEPRPDSLMRRTRVASAAAAAPVRATRASEAPAERPTAAPDRPSAQPASSTSGTVGKATVERMVAKAKGDSNRAMMIGGVGLVGVIAVILLLVIPPSPPPPPPPPPPATPSSLATSEIAAANMTKVVFLEVGWKVIHTPTGSQVYHLYVPETDQRGRPRLDQNGNIIKYAAYLRLPNGGIEPVLVLDDGNGLNQPIGGQHTGSGFVVSSDGFILTNRHVAATWHTSYQWSQSAFPGKLYAQGRNGYEVVGMLQGPDESLARWVPAEAKTLGYKPISGKILEGRNDYLDVTFAKNELRIPGQLVRTSNRHDVAMIKIEIAESLEKVELFDNYDAIETGSIVTVMGYPAVSPPVVVGTRSNDPFNRAQQYTVVPDPTVTAGNVGRIIRGQEAPSGRSEYEYWSFFGDSYQLTINATGGGNSGGPVYDDQGRVIGIFYAGKWERDGTKISFAVPIRYGIELMGTRAVLN